MDAASAALADLRGSGAFVLRCELQSPFRVRVADDAAATVIAPLRGPLAVWGHDVPQTTVAPGEVAVLPRVGPYDVCPSGAEPEGPAADRRAGEGDAHPRAAPVITIRPGGRCEDDQGRDLSASLRLDTRVWGTRRGGSHAFVTGSYASGDQLGLMLLSTLPTIATAPAPPHLVELLATELAVDEPGQAAVLDRVVDLLLVSTLRAWFSDPDHGAPAGWRAQSDEVIGPVLDLMHERPAHPWTVGELAQRVGWSRATIARRFTDLVGTPPMAYLTGWRLDLAADRLRRTPLPVTRIAREVGYEDAFAFSTAFKRRHGSSPRAYRDAGRAMDPGEHLQPR